ncbi:MAG: DapH/DapD/GlmU-related protein [Candidatus Nanoarchaeia archaeon]|nr:DapH/DapD/GlmU-related protein [Candidatus Nanoarchaeia archaeon]
MNYTKQTAVVIASLAVIFLNGIISSIIAVNLWASYTDINQKIMIFPSILLAYVMFIGLSMLTLWIELKVSDCIYPVKEGYFKEGSKGYTNWTMRSSLMASYEEIFIKIMPRFLRILIYLAMGLKIKKIPKIVFLENMIECEMIELGKGVVIGNDATITGHILDRGVVYIKKIKIGDNSTIGAKSIIMPGVEIGKNSVVAAGAIVPKNTNIPANEIWGGVPAKRIKKIKK